MTALNEFVLDFVLNALWQVMVIAAIAALGNWSLMRVASARQRHFVWVATLVLSIALPLWSALPLKRATLSLPRFIAPSATMNTGVPAQTSPAQVSPQEPENGARRRNLPVGEIFVGLYLLFLLYRLDKLWRAWKLTSAIRQGAFPVAASTALQEVMTHCRSTLRIGEVALLGSPSVALPVAVGLRQPSIILPEPLLAETSTDLLRAALGHELAHIRRRDFVWNLVYEFLFLPISFHPAAVLVRRRINETRELACDEAVSTLLMEAKPYANALIKLASFASAAHHPTYILGVSDADILEERVMKLLEKKTTAHPHRATALLAVTLFLLALLGVGVAAMPLSIRQEKSTSNELATRLVGRWKAIIDRNRTHEIILTMEGEKLVGAMRVGDNGFKPLPALKVSEKDVSWKEKDPTRPGLVLVTNVRLMSEDEILFEAVNPFDYYGAEKLLEVHPTTWILKRQR